MIETLERIRRRRVYLEHRARDQLSDAKMLSKDKRLPGGRKRVMMALAAYKRTVSSIESLYEREIMIEGFWESLENIRVLDQSQRAIARAHTVSAVEAIMDSVQETMEDVNDVINAASVPVDGGTVVSDKELDDFLEHVEAQPSLDEHIDVTEMPMPPSDAPVSSSGLRRRTVASV